MMKRYFTYTLAFFVLSVSSQTVDFTHLNLFVTPVPDRSEIQGMVFHTFTQQGQPDSIYLNGIKMNYHFAHLNGKSVEFKYDDKGFWLYLTPDQLRDTNILVISYDCKPRKGIYFVGWDDETGQAPRQIWTQGQGTDHRHWIPHRDDQTDKVIVNLSILFDKDYQVVANGVAEVKNLSSDYNQWDFSMNKPMSSYLIALAIGQYDSVQSRGQDGIPLTQYYYPEREGDYNYYYAHNEKIYDYILEEIGIPYPWANYKQVPVQDFRHGAMENTTATIFGDFFLVDSIAVNDRNYTYVNAHELAHQWFGNYVTALNSKHHWLHEGFATYYQWLSEQNLYGKDFFDWERWKAAEMVFAASLTDNYPLASEKAGSARFYQKGAWVLYMLQNMLGDEAYRQSIKHYLNNHALGIVTTEDLRQSVLEMSGKDIQPFLDKWVKRAGEPQISINSEVRGNALFFKINIPRDSALGSFLIDIPLTVYFKDGSSQEFVLDSLQSGDSVAMGQPLPSNSPVHYWTINPNMAKLVKIQEQKPFKYWELQVLNAPGLLDRYLATKALDSFELKTKKKLLKKIVQNPGGHYAVRAEALRQAMESKEKWALKLLRLSLNSPDVQLQKEAVYFIGDFKKDFKKELETLRKGRSYELRENAIHLSIDIEQAQNNRWLYDSLHTQQPGIPGRKVEITAITYQVLLFQDIEALQKLIFRMSPTYDFHTRINAMDALLALNFYDSSMNPYLFNALFHTNWKLRSKAKTMLKGFYNNSQIKEALLQYIDQNKGDWEDYQLRMVESLEK